MGILAMDSELRSRISKLAQELGEAEQERLRGAGTIVELEELVCEIGDELTRQMLGGELAHRGNRAEEILQSCPTCGCPSDLATPRQRRLLSSRGEVKYHEPAYHCCYCRRSFFPGSRFDGITDPGHSDS
jgi:uncharacterized protein with PIN domain